MFHAILDRKSGRELFEKELIIESIAAGHLEIVIYWIQADTPLAPEEMGELLSGTLINSPFSLLEKYPTLLQENGSTCPGQQKKETKGCWPLRRSPYS